MEFCQNLKMYNKNFKFLTTKLKNKQTWTYWTSFLLPFAAFMIYFAFQKFNILTVDLGQQYIDFLSFFRKNLLTDPGKLIYNFQNGLGGSMIATDAYYLLSPVNLILFLFPQNLLPIAVYLVIGVKFGLAGLSSYYYWRREKQNKIAYSLGASCAYALSGYMVANYFNLMWLDSVILLPLLINAIDRILVRKKNHLILITFALWFTNFYTGVMTLFFGFLYLLSKLFFQEKRLRWPAFLNYFKSSVLASFLSSFVLLPVFFEMLEGKADTSAKWTLSWQFPLQQELTKLVSGAYSFHEMEAGLPNIFMTTPFLLLAICYFLCKKISWKKRLVNGILLLFLILSLSFTPFVLLWHLGQFPVWYPGRFSFILIFFCLNLGMQFLAKQAALEWGKKIIIGLLSITLVSYWYFVQNDVAFLDETTLLISTLFVALTLIFIYFIYSEHKFDPIFLSIIVILEAAINLTFSLNNLSFQNNYDYQNYQANSQQVVNYFKKTDSSLYRTEKTFYRSDNDPFTSGYNGITNFNSITNSQTMTMLSNLGYLHNSNSYTNNGGTTLTDSLLGIKYYIEPNLTNKNIPTHQKMVYNNDNHRMDLDSYAIQKDFKQLILVKNNTALPLVFFSPTSKQKTDFYVDQPIHNQSTLFKNMTGSNENLFSLIKLPKPKLKNAHQDKVESENTFTQNKNKIQGEITYLLKINTNDAYYLELPNGIGENDTTLTVNNNQIDLSVRDNQVRLISLGHNQKGTRIMIKFGMKQDQLDLSQVKLFRLNTEKMSQIINRFKNGQPEIRQHALTLTTNTFSTKKNMRLLSTIPYSRNWLIFDNGKKLKTKSYLKTFLASDLKKGKHKLTFVYIPWIFLIGILLSLISLIILKLF